MPSIDDVTLVVPAKALDVVGLEWLIPVQCRRRIVHNKAYGEAIKEGIRHCSTRYIATMDADGQHDPKELVYLYRTLLARDADMAIGQQPRRASPRQISSLFLNVAASILAGAHVPDFGSGLRVFNREMAFAVIGHLPDGFDFNAALTMIFLLHKHKVVWAQAKVEPRRSGHSFIRLEDGLRTLRTLYAYRRQ